MKLSALLVTALLAFASLTGCAANKVTNKVRSSIVRMEARSHFGEGGAVCTGFVIKPKTVLTAAHCISDVMTADGYEAILIKVDDYYDLAVLRSNTGRDTLRLRDEPVYLNERLWATGYGWGWPVPITTNEFVLIPNISPEPKAPSGIITQGGYAHGMSGGPVTDVNGDVVGIVQRSFENYGYGVGVAIIKAFLVDAGVN